jgi:hypothetical protein
VYRLLPPYELYACQVVSDVWNSRSDLLVSSRTMKTMWLPPPVGFPLRIRVIFAK